MSALVSTGKQGGAVVDAAVAQAMFRWIARTPAYRADIGAVRAIAPGTWDLPTRIRSGGWAITAAGAGRDT